MSESYYEKVGSYYDSDAVDFESRYWKNPILQRIRQAFREEVKRHHATRVLEVGIGPGFDLVHFAKIMPEVQCFGIDVSEEMCRIATAKAEAEGLTNAAVAQGSVEDLEECFPGQRYDMIYVFFGALNTVSDLSQAADYLRGVLAPGGRMVLTFVNKYYLAGMCIELLKLRPRRAFARLKPVWGGYSPTHFLASKCYTPADVKTAFAPLVCEKRLGFSILYPAWYYHGLYRRMPDRLLQWLWKWDEKISPGAIGKYGEYQLFTLVEPEMR